MIVLVYMGIFFRKMKFELKEFTRLIHFVKKEARFLGVLKFLPVQKKLGEFILDLIIQKMMLNKIGEESSRGPARLGSEWTRIESFRLARTTVKYCDIHQRSSVLIQNLDKEAIVHQLKVKSFQGVCRHVYILYMSRYVHLSHIHKPKNGCTVCHPSKSQLWEK